MRKLAVLFGLMALTSVANAANLYLTGWLQTDDSVYLAIGNNNTNFRALYGSNLGNVGTNSMLFGYGHASGQYSGAFGYGHDVSGHHAFSLGVNNKVYGTGGIALGFGLISRPYAATVVGIYNANNPSWHDTSYYADEPVFIVGKGTADTARSNALVINKNGSAAFSLEHKETTLLASAVGLTTNLSVSSTGNAAQGIGFLAKTPTVGSTGRFVTTYGLYIEDQYTPATVTSKGYGVYQPADDNLNVFAGRTRIGDSADPTADIELDVKGDVAVSLNLTVAGVFIGNNAVNRLPAQGLSTADSILTRQLGDDRYVLVGSASDLSSYYTKTQSDDRYVQTSGLTPYRTIATSYSKTEVDDKFSPYLLSSTASSTYRTIADSYTKTQVDSSLASYRTIASSYAKTDVYTQTETNDLFWSNNESQIVVGSNQAPDANAAIIVGNGVDALNPNNAFVVKKTGVVKIGDIEIDPVAGVVKVPQKGDIDMGDYE